MTGSDCWHRRDAVRPKSDNLFARRSEHVERALHVAYSEMGHVVGVERPVGAKDRQPPASLAVVHDRLGRLEVRRRDGCFQQERLRIEGPDWCQLFLWRRQLAMSLTPQLVVIAGRQNAPSRRVPVCCRAALTVLERGAEQALALRSLHVAGDSVYRNRGGWVGVKGTVLAVLRWSKTLGGLGVDPLQVPHIPYSEVLVVSRCADKMGLEGYCQRGWQNRPAHG